MSEGEDVGGVSRIAYRYPYGAAIGSVFLVSVLASVATSLAVAVSLGPSAFRMGIVQVAIPLGIALGLAVATVGLVIATIVWHGLRLTGTSDRHRALWAALVPSVLLAAGWIWTVAAIGILSAPVQIAIISAALVVSLVTVYTRTYRPFVGALPEDPTGS